MSSHGYKLGEPMHIYQHHSKLLYPVVPCSIWMQLPHSLDLHKLWNSKSTGNLECTQTATIIIRYISNIFGVLGLAFGLKKVVFFFEFRESNFVLWEEMCDPRGKKEKFLVWRENQIHPFLHLNRKVSSMADISRHILLIF